MKLRLALAALALAATSLACAQPSDYYVWKNKATGATMCEPDMPADKWTKESGPYEDSNCKFKKPT
jgi:hypothetical protein